MDDNCEKLIRKMQTKWETNNKFRLPDVVYESFKAGKKEEHNKMIELLDNYLKSYPEDIFPKISEYQLQTINDLFLSHLRFPLDRLSAHILREYLIKLKGEIENGKNK